MDFPWLVFIGMAKLGFTRREAGRLYFGEWCDLFECYKRQYNFERQGNLYRIQEDMPEDPAGALDDL